MTKTTLGFPDPDRDPMRNFRSMFPTQQMLKDIQKSMQPLQHNQALRDIQKSMRPFNTLDALADIQKSMQPFKHDQVLRDKQKSMQPLNASKVLADIQKSMQPFKGVSPAAALPDIQPFKASNVLADIQKAMQAPSFKQTLEHSLGKAAMPDLSSGIVEALRRSRADLANLTIKVEDAADLAYVREVQAEAEADDDAPSILADWITLMAEGHKRRMFLLSLAGLTEGVNLAFAYADQELPAHLDKLIWFLLALTELLSEHLFGDEEAGEGPEDPAPEDEAEAS